MQFCNKLLRRSLFLLFTGHIRCNMVVYIVYVSWNVNKYVNIIEGMTSYHFVNIAYLEDKRPK